MSKSRINETDDYNFKPKKAKTIHLTHSNQNNLKEEHEHNFPNVSDYLSQSSDSQKAPSQTICEDIVQLDYSQFPPLKDIPARGCVIAFKGPNSHYPDSLNYKQAVVSSSSATHLLLCLIDPIKRATLDTYSDWFMGDQFSPSSKESDMIESSLEDLVSPVILQYSCNDLYNG